MAHSDNLKKLRVFVFDGVRQSASNIGTMLLLNRCEEVKSMTDEEVKELKAIHDALIEFSKKIGERTEELV